MAAAPHIRRLASSLGGNPLLARAASARCGAARRATAVVVVAHAQRGKDALPVAAAGVALSTGLGGGSAYAQDTAVDTAVSSIVDVVKAAGDAVKAGLGVAQQGVEAAKDAYAAVAPAVQTAVDTAAPVVKQAVQAASPVVQAGVKAAGSAASGVKPGLERALESTGLDAKAVAGAEEGAEQAIAVARPAVESLLQFVTTSSPATLAQYALGVAAAYYLLPGVLRLGAAALRGYRGDTSPAAALDALSTQGNAVLLDIRTAREKEASGLPDLGASSGKLVELEFASIEDRRVREKLRNVGDLEVKITAMQVAALKRIGPGTAIFVMDRNGSAAKAVAKELSRRGFSRVNVINGGFSGWVRDRLGTKMSPVVSRVEVLLPGSTSYGTGSRRQAPGTSRTQRQLPQPLRRALPSVSGQ